jgi:hypothetical protein
MAVSVDDSATLLGLGDGRDDVPIDDLERRRFAAITGEERESERRNDEYGASVRVQNHEASSQAKTHLYHFLRNTRLFEPIIQHENRAPHLPRPLPCL